MNKLRLPYQDFPLNSRLTLLPSYFGFLNENIHYLKSSIESFKKLACLIPRTSFILENDEQIDSIIYEYGDAVLLLLQYYGTLLPKYAKMNDENTVIDDKRANRKLLTSIFIKLIQYSIDLSVARKRLSEEYYTFSKKQLDPSVKIDEDISIDIKNIDKQCKNVYPLFLKESVKAK